MWQQRGIEHEMVRVGKHLRAATRAIVARLVMLQTTPRDVVAQRQKELIVIVVMRVKQCLCLLDQTTVTGDLRIGNIKCSSRCRRPYRDNDAQMSRSE